MHLVGMWIVDFSDVDSGEQRNSCAVDVLESVALSVSTLLESNTSGRLDVGQDVGLRNWYARIIQRKHPRKYRWHIHLEWQNDWCALIFTDEYASEFRAIDPEFDGDVIDEQIRSMISHGSSTPYPADQCMETERARAAILEYLLTLERPDWLNYKYIP